jgi:hypothetical protein
MNQGLPQQTDYLFSNILRDFGLPSNPFEIVEPTLREEVLSINNLHDAALCELERIYQQTNFDKVTISL